MATVLLVRHGLTALTGPVLAGWTPGVHLDERGRAQASALAARLRPVPLAAIVSSPLERCQETAAQIAVGRDGAQVRTDDGLGECRYGDWTGQELKKLAKDPLWRVVQAHPSAAVFPGAEGEALRVTQERALAAVRAWERAAQPRARAGRDVARLQPRGRDQSDRRGRRGHGPGPFPAYRRGSLLADGDPLHRDPAVSRPAQTWAAQSTTCCRRSGAAAPVRRRDPLDPGGHPGDATVGGGG